MTTDVTGLCKDHSFETAEEVCRRCGLEFCGLCLVYPFGAAKPLCKECAMAEGGVRSHIHRVAMGRRDLRRKVKAFKSHLAARSVSTPSGSEEIPAERDPLVPIEPELDRVPVTIPAPPKPAPLEQSQPAPAPAPATPDPAGGVAPPIDWSQPFG